jgi:hypothetical protein
MQTLISDFFTKVSCDECGKKTECKKIDNYDSCSLSCEQELRKMTEQFKNLSHSEGTHSSPG